MKKYGTMARLPKEKQHFHCLKHSIATHLIDAGADIMFVKDWLGHKNIQNTLVYAQLTSRTREEQARRVFASLRIVR
jgi:site-specific recombinase XerD